MVDQVLKLPEGESCLLLAPLVAARKGEHHEVLRGPHRPGLRARAHRRHASSELDAAPKLDAKRKHDIEAVVDRFKVRPDIAQRLAESFETALRLGDGIARLALRRDRGREELTFSSRHACPHLRLQRAAARAEAVLVQQPGRRLPDLRRPRLPGVLRPGARGDASAAVARRRRDPRLGPAQRLLLPDDPRAREALPLRHRGALGELPRGGRRTSCCTAAARRGRVPLHRFARPRGEARASLRGHHPEPGAPLPRNRVGDGARGARQVPRHAALPRMRAARGSIAMRATCSSRIARCRRSPRSRSPRR